MIEEPPEYQTSRMLLGVSTEDEERGVHLLSKLQQASFVVEQVEWVLSKFREINKLAVN
jgi:hypothetical protein